MLPTGRITAAIPTIAPIPIKTVFHSFFKESKLNELPILTTITTIITSVIASENPPKSMISFGKIPPHTPERSKIKNIKIEGTIALVLTEMNSPRAKNAIKIKNAIAGCIKTPPSILNYFID